MTAGADFGAELAADVLAQPLMALAEPLAELEQAQVFRQAGFAHEAVLDVARQDVPQPLRSALHARIAAGMAQRASDWLAIPLCPTCHRGPTGVHGDRGILRRIKADEAALLADVIELLSED